MQEYDKLVRDKIPGIISKNGDNPCFDVGRKDDINYQQLLLLKLEEECIEYDTAHGLEDLVKEITDCMEVLDALHVAYGFPKPDWSDVSHVCEFVPARTEGDTVFDVAVLFMPFPYERPEDRKNELATLASLILDEANRLPVQLTHVLHVKQRRYNERGGFEGCTYLHNIHD